ncbi:MAG: hypothetical protein KDD40_11965, partial [Bdellovibrionales bacterium]|nr:hypothetical protein [Bdellovibrionales bacterium]
MQLFKQQVYPHFQSHIFIQSSGSNSTQKWVALSKTAILSSATAVNQHIQAKKEDVWFATL